MPFFKRMRKRTSLYTIRSYLVPLHGYAHMFIVPFIYWNSAFHQLSSSRAVYLLSVWAFCIFCWIYVCNVSREKLQIWSRAVHITIEFYWQSSFFQRVKKTIQCPLPHLPPSIQPNSFKQMLHSFKKKLFYLWPYNTHIAHNIEVSDKNYIA